MGVEEHRHAAPARVTCAVLTISDTRTEQTDVCGPVIRARLEHAGHHVAIQQILPDDRERISSAVRVLGNDDSIDAVIISGGTGLAPRDNTFEAVCGLFHKIVDGFGELFRMLSYEEIGPAAMLSRAAAGVIGNTVVFALPGSPAACTLALDKLIVPELGHVVSLVNPHKHRS